MELPATLWVPKRLRGWRIGGSGLSCPFATELSATLEMHEAALPELSVVDGASVLGLDVVGASKGSVEGVRLQRPVSWMRPELKE